MKFDAIKRESNAVIILRYDSLRKFRTSLQEVGG